MSPQTLCYGCRQLDTRTDGSGGKTFYCRRMPGAVRGSINLAEDDPPIACDTPDLGASSERPIPMVLHCRNCRTQHIDEPDPQRGWTNPPHRSHECQECGFIWRPADVPTTGVEAIATRGQLDG